MEKKVAELVNKINSKLNSATEETEISPFEKQNDSHDGFSPSYHSISAEKFPNKSLNYPQYNEPFNCQEPSKERKRALEIQKRITKNLFGLDTLSSSRNRNFRSHELLGSIEEREEYHSPFLKKTTIMNLSKIKNEPTEPNSTIKKLKNKNLQLEGSIKQLQSQISKIQKNINRMSKSRKKEEHSKSFNNDKNKKSLKKLQKMKRSEIQGAKTTKQQSKEKKSNTNLNIPKTNSKKQMKISATYTNIPRKDHLKNQCGNGNGGMVKSQIFLKSKYKNEEQGKLKKRNRGKTNFEDQMSGRLQFNKSKKEKNRFDQTSTPIDVLLTEEPTIIEQKRKNKKSLKLLKKSKSNISLKSSSNSKNNNNNNNMSNISSPYLKPVFHKNKKSNK